MRPWHIGLLVIAMCGASLGQERVVRVDNAESLRSAVRSAGPGTRIVVAPGTYAGGINVSRIQGTKEAPVIIEAEDAGKPPVFRGGSVSFHFSGCSYLVLRNLHFDGQRANGINIDDAGDYDRPSRYILLENLTITNVGPTGNRDGVKISGVRDFIIRNCKFEGWGGSAIDMVGCHDGLIEKCEFRAKAGFSQGTGPQAKGGSSGIVVRQCLFVGPMQRGVNIGGSTGMQFFRPQNATCEASKITVEGCRFIGTGAPVAFVGVDGAVVRYNTMYMPDQWALRILQENTNQRMVASRNGRFEHNLVILRSPPREGGVNIGPNTNAKTFTFAGNWWHVPGMQGFRPSLPAEEKDGVYGRDPLLSVDDSGKMTLAPNSPAGKVGAHAYPPPQAQSSR